jgi:rRNA-processing protein CGR1
LTLTLKIQAQIMQRKNICALHIIHTPTHAHGRKMSEQEEVQLPKLGKAPQVRVNGKNWKETKTPFRTSSLSVPLKHRSWERRQKERENLRMIKAKEKEMKDEKEAEHAEKVRRIKERRMAKEEKERLEKMTAILSAKKLARRKRKEKRNKLLRERN